MAKKIETNESYNVKDLISENKKLYKVIDELDDINKKYYDKICLLENYNIDLLNNFIASNKENVELSTKYKYITNSRMWKVFKQAYTLRDNIKKVFLRDGVDDKINKDESALELLNDCSARRSIDDLFSDFSKYDIISFDIFDTLVFRKISNPIDLFRIMEENLAISNFCSIRTDCETEARNNTNKNNREINIFDIYKEMEKVLKIDVNEMINKELSLELDLCYPNKYMKELYDKLIDSGKKVIITSDMYWPKKYLKKILKSCGYNKYDELFVSCEYQAGKGNGNIQNIISKQYKTRNIMHIGDNFQSDILGSKCARWHTYHYKKASDLAQKNSELLKGDSLSCSIINSIISDYLYSGGQSFNCYHKYGFAYCGILVAGFLDYIDGIVKNNNIDKILFLARDTKIMYDVYNKYYKTYDNDYFITSRSAMLEISFEKNMKSFIDFYFKIRAIIAKDNIYDALVQTDLDCLLPYLEEYNLNGGDIITLANFKSVEKMLYDKKEIIIANFESSKQSAIKYIKKTIGNSKRILCVDLGWSGTIVTSLREFIKDNIGSDIEVYGAFVGNNDAPKVNILVDKGLFFPYCFSYNNKQYYLNTSELKDNTKAMIMEAIFTSTDATLLKYDKDFVYGSCTSNEEILSDIHSGISEFVKKYKCNSTHLHSQISSDTAFELLYKKLDDIKYNYVIFKNFKEYNDSLPRFYGDREITTLGKIIESRNIM